MDYSLTIIELILFAILMTGTPGPGNLLMMAAGSASINFNRIIYFLIGILAGKTLVNIAISFGIGFVIIENELFYTLLKILSSVFIIYISAMSLKKESIGSKNINLNKFTFKNGLIVHPLSPKTWSMIIIAHTEISSLNTNYYLKSLIIWIIFILGAITFHALYAYAGIYTGKIFSGNFNISRGLFLLTILFVLWFLFNSP